MFRKFTFLLLITGLLLTACGVAVDGAPVAPAPALTEAPVAGEARVFVDDAGREITLAGAPQRIVSLAPSNTEILFAIGAGAQVVGRDEFSDYPDQAKGLASVGGSLGQYSTEAVVALEPDLVLAAEINTPELIHSLEDLGITVYYLRNPTTLEELFTNLINVGDLTGRQAEAAALVESLQARVAAVDEKLAPISARPSVFYEIDATDPGKPYTYGPGTFGDLLITRAGGFNIGGELTDPYPQISLEQIVVSNPNFIILGDSMWGVTPESVAARPGWEGLAAVQEGHIFPFDDNLVSRPGPRLVDGLEQLARLLHPGLFE
jgi:iron complex transport system substrate-binding protein